MPTSHRTLYPTFKKKARPTGGIHGKIPQLTTQARPIGGIHGQTFPMDEMGGIYKQPPPPLEAKEAMYASYKEEDAPNLAAARKWRAVHKLLLGKEERKPGKGDAEAPQNPVANL